MERLSSEELDAIRTRTEKTTEGPWSYDDFDKTIFINKFGAPSLIETHAEISDYDSYYEFTRKEDAEFIAHAREDVPKLLAEVERLRRELSFIAHVDMLTNAYDAEHIAVSVKSWALNVLEGVNHDD